MGYLKREKRRKVYTLLLTLMMCVTAVGCKKNDSNNALKNEVQEEEATNDSVNNQEEQATTDSIEPEEEMTQEEQEEITEAEEDEEDEEDEYQQMIHKTLLSTGNNVRLKKVIEKAKNGEDVTLAYIGGSITEGANSPEDKNYVTLSYNYFKDTFATNPDSVHLINAGMSGTPSSLGAIRYDRDVLGKAKTQPDVIFIEFAVNDYQECTNGEAYESIIRKVLSAENEPAVVLVFSVSKSRWNIQETFIPLGEYYELPMVSIRNGVNWALDTEESLSEAEFFSDDYHPTDFGHQIMSDCIDYLWNTVDSQEATPEDITIPEESKIGDAYVNEFMLDSSMSGAVTVDGREVTIDAGSFDSVDSMVARFNYSKEMIFPLNWMHTTDSGSNESLKIQANSKTMMLVYKSSNSQTAGSIEILVNGEVVKTVDSYNAGGWNNAETVSVFANDVAQDSTIEIRMKDGDEAKDFTILAIGLSD